MSDHASMMKRRELLADFGELALRSQELDSVVQAVHRLVGGRWATGRAKILQIRHETKVPLVRTGVLH
jgi:hypothetical protein